MSATVEINIPMVHHGDLTLYLPSLKYCLGVQSVEGDIETRDDNDDDPFDGADLPLPLPLSFEYNEGEPIRDPIGTSGETNEDDHDVEIITEALVMIIPYSM
ncbi:hypothetical protein FNV43_RR04372 [Rhamnella rubrinervis]|uniref:Uncharacterized protein n=1 Tax=Rhamnella rubrinervis TaxID=2594499 RepID=A0A8K0HJF9_9ROSA|nr:hypothetical protein FNV43_RR04372 [Rhamnella rubrinervis]